LVNYRNGCINRGGFNRNIYRRIDWSRSNRLGLDDWGRGGFKYKPAILSPNPVSPVTVRIEYGLLAGRRCVARVSNNDVDNPVGCQVYKGASHRLNPIRAARYVTLLGFFKLFHKWHTGAISAGRARHLHAVAAHGAEFIHAGVGLNVDDPVTVDATECVRLESPGVNFFTPELIEANY
jgi:hypothetical protein